VTVVDVQDRSPRLRSVRLRGDLTGYQGVLPAASTRLLLPRDGVIELPTWDGNLFLHADGSRAVLRTLTPLRPAAGEVTVEVVRHGDGPLSAWASEIEVGAEAALSGPGRGYAIDPAARSFLLVGDESALPAIGQLLATLPPSADVHALVEVADPTGELDLGPAVTWLVSGPDAPAGHALVDAVGRATIEPDTRVWAAGEAAAMHRIRTHLFDGVGLPRAHGTVRGYWKARGAFQGSGIGEGLG
jgi:NADPH-dependent ferric siderophore reductase